MTTGQADTDDAIEVITAAGDQVTALDGRTGSVEWQTRLTSEQVQMTPPPVLADLDGDSDPELVAVINNGIVSVLDPTTGEIIASYKREVAVWTHPTVANLDTDSADEVLVMYGDGRVVALDYAT